jgi:hypothetical protein
MVSCEKGGSMMTYMYPNVPLASPDPEKKNGETPVVQHLHIPRGALQKHQKAEVCDF